jgi:hypothetical protein
MPVSPGINSAASVLEGVGVSTSLAVRIYKKYGDKSVDVVRAEPYRTRRWAGCASEPGRLSHLSRRKRCGSPLPRGSRC